MIGPDDSIGPYQVSARIGRGGMGEVFKAGRYPTPQPFPRTSRSAHAPGRLRMSADGQWLFVVLPGGVGCVTTE